MMDGLAGAVARSETLIRPAVRLSRETFCWQFDAPYGLKNTATGTKNGYCDQSCILLVA
jgi:hypothetical protein